MITCPLCEPGCNCCDFCKHYDFNADEQGRYVDKGWCRFHLDFRHPGDDCDDFHCEDIYAELIIKECEVALKPMLRDMISRGIAVELIREHFGVK